MNQTMATQWIALSERVYRTLLILYPADYRREYGALMLQIFRDVSLDKYHRQGIAGIMLWWYKTLLDLTFTAIEQRRKVKYPMSKSTFVQLTGILLIVGGACGAIAAFSQFQPDDHNTYYGIYQLLIWLTAPGLLFGGLGCIGLALRYEQALGTPGQWTLYVCGIGAMVMSVGVIAMSLEDSLRNVFLGGGLLHILGLTAFGMLHLHKPILPIFRAFPLQIAAGMVVWVLGFPELFAQPTDNLLTFLFFVGVGLAWLGIGLTVNRLQREAALAAA
jgi:hypothetical protein